MNSDAVTVAPSPLSSSPNATSTTCAKKFAQKSLASRTIGQLLDAWSQGHSKNPLKKPFAPHRSTRPKELDPALLPAIVARWEQTNRPYTTFQYLQLLRAFVRYVDLLSNTDLSPHVPRRPRPAPRSVTWTDDEYTLVLKHAPPWLAVLVIVARRLGLRVSEARTPRDWNRIDNSLTISRKGDNASTLPVPDELIAALTHCHSIAPDKPIMVTLGARGFSRQTISVHLQQTLQRAGIKRRIVFHDLRRTIATDLLVNSKDIRLVQRLLGHRNLPPLLPTSATAKLPRFAKRSKPHVVLLQSVTRIFGRI